MGAGDGSRQIERGTAASAAFAAGVRRAMAITAAMNRLTFAAGSVVTRDVPPNTLVGGNPATVLRSIAGL